ncbi:MAG: UDP-N-acetylmuramoyl-L-alanine--D-glutamate ligase [Bacteroidales bacterium]|nr:UDP-N-acetylmuramoyl-L-alanine--D-glutamate ligase [Bacteroidales bacterium]
MDNQEKYKSLRQQHKLFTYESFSYKFDSEGMCMSFNFSVGDTIHFRPTARIPRRNFLAESLPGEVADLLVFNIGMIELISYWKCLCPPTVRIVPCKLCDEQLAFWRKLYYNGLGEFFYTNGIKATEQDFMKIECTGTRDMGPVDITLGNGYLVPVGGGKDSVVSLELLREANVPMRPLIMNPRGATTLCAQRAGFSPDDTLVVNRTLDSTMLELNRQGCLNGHTPFSAMLAFYTLLAAALSGERNIALSNESSANEATIPGTKVNHQYSKSLEFENDFRAYVATYISSSFNYFSLLRPLSELQIAMLFSRHSKYFDVFKSCNAGSKQDIWCGKCAKCLFAYIILSPFIEPPTLQGVFGKDLLDDPDLAAYFDDLTGRSESKPFECVGTIDEVNTALAMTIDRWYSDNTPRPALLRNYSPTAYKTHTDTLFTDHNLRQPLLALLQEAIGRQAHTAVGNTAPGMERLRQLLDGRRILIAGYGREGRSSHKLIESLAPNATVVIADGNDNIQREAATGYDLIIKSPGIPSFVFDGLCDPCTITSQTDLFLRCYGSQTIGITGTKGKSTTTTLLHSILTAGGFNAILAGNMGIPLFDIIPSIAKETIVVAELSCHQLENIHTAPHISLLLNLYEEHLDHYRSYTDYQNAKLNIATKQQAGDLFYYCRDNADLAGRMAGTTIASHATPYSFNDMKSDSDLHWIATLPRTLVGDHNLSNILATWLIASQTGVSRDTFAQTVATFSPLHHRLEPIGTYNGVQFYNDSISTIPQATIAALEALQHVDTLILGGFDRGIDYTPLVDYLAQHRVANIVYVGQAGRRMKELIEAAPDSGITNNIVEDNYEKIVLWCLQRTPQGGICLLSPAAASYDSFRNFEHRGDTFRQLLSKYQK